MESAESRALPGLPFTTNCSNGIGGGRWMRAIGTFRVKIGLQDLAEDRCKARFNRRFLCSRGRNGASGTRIQAADG